MEISQWKHPEVRDGEVFVRNITEQQYKHLGFLSKRIGVHTYDGEGRPLGIDDWFPIFIKADELQRKSLTLRALRRSLRETLDHVSSKEK